MLSVQIMGNLPFYSVSVPSVVSLNKCILSGLPSYGSLRRSNRSYVGLYNRTRPQYETRQRLARDLVGRGDLRPFDPHWARETRIPKDRPMIDFEGIVPAIAQALEKRGYSELTPVQR